MYDIKLEKQLVEDPVSHILINLAPLFEMLHNRFNSNVKDMYKAIDDAIRSICLYSDLNESYDYDFKNLIGRLYEIRDMFDKIEQLKGMK